jgi:hypothetical protein
MIAEAKIMITNNAESFHSSPLFRKRCRQSSAIVPYLSANNAQRRGGNFAAELPEAQQKGVKAGIKNHLFPQLEVSEGEDRQNTVSLFFVPHSSQSQTNHNSSSCQQHQQRRSSEWGNLRVGVAKE